MLADDTKIELASISEQDGIAADEETDAVRSPYELTI